MRNLSFVAFILLLSCSDPQEVVFEPEIEAEAELYALNTVGENQYSVSKIKLVLRSFLRMVISSSFKSH